MQALSAAEATTTAAAAPDRIEVFIKVSWGLCDADLCSKPVLLRLERRGRVRSLFVQARRGRIIDDPAPRNFPSKR
jgi:hypothetical protein